MNQVLKIKILSICILLHISSCRFLQQSTPGVNSTKGGESPFGREGAEDGSSSESSDRVIIITNINELPACTEANVNQVYYVESSKEFFVCSFDGSNYGHQPLDVDSNDLLLQNCSDADLLQEATEIVVGDATCSEGLGGTTISLGCDLNGNGSLDLNATPNELSGSSRNICNVSAPPLTTANMNLALAPGGNDSANCQTATPCLTFATVISKVPKTINHTVTISIEAGMTLTETVRVQGFTIGGTGRLNVQSATAGTDWTVNGSGERDYGVLIEGVSGTGKMVLHDVSISNAVTAGVYVDSSIATFGKLTVTSNGTGDTSTDPNFIGEPVDFGIWISNGSRVDVLGASDGGPYTISTSSNNGTGIAVQSSSEVNLSQLSSVNNTGHGIHTKDDSDLDITSLADVLNNQIHGVFVQLGCEVELTGDTAVDVSGNTVGTQITTATSAAIRVIENSDLTLTNIRATSTTNIGIDVGTSRLTATQSTFNNSGLSGVNLRINATASLNNCAISNNTTYGISAERSSVYINDTNTPNTSYIRSNTLAGFFLDDQSAASVTHPYEIVGNDSAGSDAAVEIGGTGSSAFERSTFLGSQFLCQEDGGGAALGCGAVAGPGSDAAGTCTGAQCANPN